MYQSVVRFCLCLSVCLCLSMRPPIGLRDCVIGLFCCVIVRDCVKTILFLRDCVNRLACVMRESVEKCAWFREIIQRHAWFRERRVFVQFQRFCVKIPIFHRLRECVKMEKNLRDCVIGDPPWGASFRSQFWWFSYTNGWIHFKTCQLCHVIS